MRICTLLARVWLGLLVLAKHLGRGQSVQGGDVMGARDHIRSDDICISMDIHGEHVE